MLISKSSLGASENFSEVSSRVPKPDKKLMASQNVWKLAKELERKV